MASYLSHVKYRALGDMPEVRTDVAGVGRGREPGRCVCGGSRFFSDMACLHACEMCVYIKMGVCL